MFRKALFPKHGLLPLESCDRSFTTLIINPILRVQNQTLPCVSQVRYKPVYPKIRGLPRPQIPGKKVPEPFKYNWIPILPKVMLN